MTDAAHKRPAAAPMAALAGTALVVVAAFTVAAATTAAAASDPQPPAPTNTQPDTNTDADTGGGGGGSGGGGGEPEGFGVMIPDVGAGSYPTASYDIGYDQGAWNQLDRKALGFLTNLAFTATKAAVSFALWVISWAYGFGIVAALGDPATNIADLFQTRYVGPLGLRQLAVFALVAWVGFQGLRGRLAMAFGELVISVGMAVVGMFLIANPNGYLTGTFDTMARLSGSFLAVAAGGDPVGDAEDQQAILAPLQANIHQVFIEEPYDLVNWGQPLTGACAAARDAVVADGPWGSDDEPRDSMAAAGCDINADFNNDPTAERLIGAVLTLVAAAVVVVLLVTIAATVLVAQVLTIVLFAVGPFAWVAGILPGAGRELFYRWAAALLRAVFAVVGMSLVLSLLLLLVDELLTTAADVTLIERFSLLILVAVSMFVVRAKIVAAGANLARRVAHKAATSRLTTISGGWTHPTPNPTSGGWPPTPQPRRRNPAAALAHAGHRYQQQQHHRRTAHKPAAPRTPTAASRPDATAQPGPTNTGPQPTRTRPEPRRPGPTNGTRPPDDRPAGQTRRGAGPPAAPTTPTTIAKPTSGTGGRDRPAGSSSSRPIVGSRRPPWRRPHRDDP